MSLDRGRDSLSRLGTYARWNPTEGVEGGNDAICCNLDAMLEILRLSDVSHKEKDKYHTSLICGTWYTHRWNCLERDTESHARRADLGLPRFRGRARDGLEVWVSRRQGPRENEWAGRSWCLAQGRTSSHCVKTRLKSIWETENRQFTAALIEHGPSMIP